MRAIPTSLAAPLALVAALSACGGEGARAPRAQRVILITCDTLRADRLGVYGYERPTSPELDAFAREAVVFDRCYSHAPMTGPAVSSLMTGLLPDELGIGAGNHVLISPDETTLAELARDAGVPTAAVVSNWVLRRYPPPAEGAGVQQGFEHFDQRMSSTELVRGMPERLAPDTTDAALEWLDGLGASERERFFLWVHYQDPHGPYTPPEELVAPFLRPPREQPRLPVGENNRGYRQLPKYQVLGDAREPDYYRARYDAEIRLFDRELGRLLDRLRADGLLEDALVVVTADHGEALGEHGFWFCHGENLFRELVNVPLIVRFPGGATQPSARQAGVYRRVEQLVGHLDLWPTVLDALGLAGARNRGVSLFDAVPGGRAMVQQVRDPGASARWHALTEQTLRLVVPQGGPPLLFDHALAPSEPRDLAPQRPAEVERLAARYRGIAVEAGRGFRPEAGVRPTIAADDAHMMELLGYAVGDDGEDPDGEPADGGTVDPDDEPER